MTRTLRKFLRLLAFALLAPLLATAAVPKSISYQGYLTNSLGTPITATVPMQFRLFDAMSGGSQLWSESQSVTVSNGIFSVALGSVTTLNLPFTQPYYLEVQVGGDPPMSPRQPLSSAPYAMAAAVAQCALGDYINCYPGPAGTEGVGQCRTGRRTCDPATLTFGACTGSITPSAEVVDGIDNDCDGTIDNLPGPPTISGVTSPNANGTYGLNTPITVQVTFNEPVFVTGGVPQLALNSGGTASYVSGSSTATLMFQNTVGAGQNSPDLDYASSAALTLAGALIRDGSNTDAVLTLPAPGTAGSLGANKAIVIDTTGPTISGVSSTTPDGAYSSGSVIAITVTFSEPVFVAGLPQLALNSGGIAYHASGTGTTVQTFNYTVGAGQSTADLDYNSAGALTLAGGTIMDASLNNAVLTLPAPGAAGSLGANKAIVIDSALPAVTSVTSPTANGSYGTGASIVVTVNFSEAVTVTGNPSLALNSGGTATYASGSGTNSLAFSYTVASGQSSADLDYTSTSALSLNGGTIRDGAANNATLTLPAPGAANSLGANKAIVIDAVAPFVQAVSSFTANGSYTVGSTISIQLNFSEAVVVSGGTPTLALNSGGTASYVSGSGTSTLNFSYTVASGQASADLDYTSSTTALSLGGATIRDGAGNNMTLFLPTPGSAASLGGSKAIVIF